MHYVYKKMCESAVTKQKKKITDSVLVNNICNRSNLGSRQITFILQIFNLFEQTRKIQLTDQIFYQHTYIV